MRSVLLNQPPPPRKKLCKTISLIPIRFLRLVTFHQRTLCEPANFSFIFAHIKHSFRAHFPEPAAFDKLTSESQELTFIYATFLICVQWLIFYDVAGNLRTSCPESLAAVLAADEASMPPAFFEASAVDVRATRTFLVSRIAYYAFALIAKSAFPGQLNPATTDDVTAIDNNLLTIPDLILDPLPPPVDSQATSTARQDDAPLSGPAEDRTFADIANTVANLSQPLAPTHPHVGPSFRAKTSSKGKGKEKENVQSSTPQASSSNTSNKRSREDSEDPTGSTGTEKKQRRKQGKLSDTIECDAFGVPMHQVIHPLPE